LLSRPNALSLQQRVLEGLEAAESRNSIGVRTSEVGHSPLRSGTLGHHETFRFVSGVDLRSAVLAQVDSQYRSALFEGESLDPVAVMREEKAETRSFLVCRTRSPQPLPDPLVGRYENEHSAAVGEVRVFRPVGVGFDERSQR